MKKTFLTINFLLAVAVSLSAQLDAGRTTKTKIIDALAGTPAQNTPAYTTLIQELSTTGPDGLQELISMHQQSTGEMRVKTEYLLSSLAAFAGQMNDATYTDALQKVWMSAIKNAQDPAASAFYLEQLKLAGNDQCVDFLASYLTDKDLAQYAASVLSAIHTPKAGAAVMQALPKVAPGEQKHLIAAIGEMELAEAEDLLLSLVPVVSEADRNLLLAAIADCGTEKSLSVLQKEAASAGYAYEKNGSTDALLTLCRRITASGNQKAVGKIADELMKQAGKNGDSGLMCAAYTLITETSPKSAKAALKGLDIKDRALRNTVLRQLVSASDNEAVMNILKKSNRADDEARIDIFSWAGENKLAQSLPFLIPAMRDKSAPVAEAAIRNVGLIGGDVAVKALSGLLVDGSSEQIALTKQVLSYTPGKISEPLMASLDPASPEGKAAILTLVGSKKDTGYARSFLQLCKHDHPQVRQTAVSQLRHVVTATHIPDLFAMLHAVPASEVRPVQQALVSALGSLPADKRFEAVNNQIRTSGNGDHSRYFGVLSSIPGERSLALVESGFRGDEQTRTAAVEALCEWEGTEALEPLYTLCSSEETAAHAPRAWNAYVNKVNGSTFTAEKKLIFLRKALAVAQTKEQKQQALNALRKINVYPALFVAAPYLDDQDVREEACQAIMNIALNNTAFAGEEVNSLLTRVSGLLDNPDKGYQQQAIQKYITENAGKKGFVSLFNGKDLTGWKGLVGNPLTRAGMTPAQLKKAQQKADEEMRASWTVEDGLLVFGGKGDNICTDRPYGDFEMYVDWCLDPIGPEPDAGIYLRGTPQVQIWDTARINVGAQVGSGGLYNNQKNESKPVKVADNRLGEWNSFFIRMKGERVSVWLNGDQVVDNVIMENYWDRSQPVPMLEQIELQAHGSRVAYRNIYVREIPRAEAFALSDQEKKEGFRVLFDGTSMINWKGNTRDYIVEDGCIALYPQNKGGGNLYTKEEYGDFVFRFDFQLTPGANNGLGIRTPDKGDAAYVGMELQILDNEAPVYKDLEKYQYHGSVYGVIPAKRGFLKNPGEWNTQEVVAKGDHIKVTLNGEVILDGNIREAGGNGTADKRAHPGLFNPKGHIAFLGHGSEVKFRNIRVKKLD